ncbi:hypothetical protein DRP77_03580 [Candidatus Poribacteria bacterium]|nr:MAG: hypothetical protein DRP77_03580 [Candidatus Poribacteria bacterium]
MRRADNLIFAVIIGLIFTCAAMEFKVKERKLELMPMPSTASRKSGGEREIPLNELAPAGRIDPLPPRNPFKPPEWLVEERGERREPVERSIDLKLTAICWSAEEPMAVINGRIFREGEVDPSAGFEVEKIGPDEVVVKTPWGERRTLKLGEVMGR